MKTQVPISRCPKISDVHFFPNVPLLHIEHKNDTPTPDPAKRKMEASKHNKLPAGRESLFKIIGIINKSRLITSNWPRFLPWKNINKHSKLFLAPFFGFDFSFRLTRFFKRWAFSGIYYLFMHIGLMKQLVFIIFAVNMVITYGNSVERENGHFKLIMLNLIYFDYFCQSH